MLRGCTTIRIRSLGTLTASRSAMASAKLSKVGDAPFVAATSVCLPETFLSPVGSGGVPVPSRMPASSLSESTFMRWSVRTLASGGSESSRTSFDTWVRAANLRGVATTVESVGSWRDCRGLGRPRWGDVGGQRRVGHRVGLRRERLDAGPQHHARGAEPVEQGRAQLAGARTDGRRERARLALADRADRLLNLIVEAVGARAAPAGLQGVAHHHGAARGRTRGLVGG